MLASDVDQQIGLHLGGVVAAWACVGRRRAWLCVGLEHVLDQAALLNKALRTHVADIRFVSSVLLHVVEHRVLASLRDPAVGANELPLLILVVDEFRTGHRTRWH